MWQNEFPNSWTHNKKLYWEKDMMCWVLGFHQGDVEEEWRLYVSKKNTKKWLVFVLDAKGKMKKCQNLKRIQSPYNLESPKPRASRIKKNQV